MYDRPRMPESPDSLQPCPADLCQRMSSRLTLAERQHHRGDDYWPPTPAVSPLDHNLGKMVGILIDNRQAPALSLAPLLFCPAAVNRNSAG